MKLFSKDLKNDPYPLTFHKHLYTWNDGYAAMVKILSNFIL